MQQTHINNVAKPLQSKHLEGWQHEVSDVLPSSQQQTVDGVIEHRFPRPNGHSLEVSTSTILLASWALTIGRMNSAANALIYFATTAQHHSFLVDRQTSPNTPGLLSRIHFDLSGSQRVSSYLKAAQAQVTQHSCLKRTGEETMTEIKADGGNLIVPQAVLLIRPHDIAPARDVVELLWDDIRYYGISKRTLVLDIQIALDKVMATAVFDPKTVAPWSVQKVLIRLEHVMGQLVAADKEAILTNVDAVAPQELECIWTWNKSVPASIQRCAHDIVAEKSRFQPNAPAVCAWDGNLTYFELDQLATKVAIQLIDIGIHENILVPICFEKSKWAAIAMLGVLKAGGGFVLLDPELPESRLKTMFEQTDSEILVSSAANAKLSSRLSTEVIEIGPYLYETPETGPSWHAKSQSSSTAMFAVFTSGSTGVPKGVVLTHENFCSSVCHHIDLIGMTSNSRLFDFASYAFDVAIHDVFATLIAGACVCIPSDKDRKENLASAIIAMRATILDLTPTVARLLDPDKLPDLKTIVFAGEAVDVEDCRRWRGKARVINCYGPAECHYCVVNSTSSSPEEETRIGKGAGAVTWVVDTEDSDRLAALGCIGELLIEGPTVGQGYIRDVKKTTAAFINDPAFLLRGAMGHNGRRGRLYKTGDLVHYNEDGSLTFVGRKDTQVKIRGQRVELGEVERSVQELLHNTHQVVVEVIQPAMGSIDPLLTAFMQVDNLLDDDGQPTVARLFPITAELKDKLAKRLPNYMVPTVLVSIHAIPVTATGKIDRRRLRAIGESILLNENQFLSPSPQDAPGSEDHVAILETEQPAYALAQKIASMLPPCYRSRFEEPLPRSNQVVGLSDATKRYRDVALLHSGLDSVNMMSLIHYISKEFNVKLGMLQLMDQSTRIRDLARCILEQQASAVRGIKNCIPSAIDLMAEINRHDYRICGLQESMACGMQTQSWAYRYNNGPDTKYTVFLTGANGYIGTQILRQLIEHRQVSRVIALVRGETLVLGRLRIIDAARKSLWWTELHEEKLEVWTGDLSLPRLGLESTNWSLLAESVDIIIHNGAAVHFAKTYGSLEATNVCSTVDLLLLTLSSPSLRFVYVSSRRPFDFDGPDDEVEERIARQLAATGSTAYSQTKFVSEALVRRVARRSSCAAKRLVVVSPGYVIGTPTEGIANADDYVWRLVAACARVGAYSIDEAHMWLPLSDAATTASIILSSAFNLKKEGRTVIQVTDGITWDGIWRVLGMLGYRFKALDAQEWLTMVRRDMEAALETHPLWPLADMLDDQKIRQDGRQGEKWCSNGGETPLRLKVALRKGAECLGRIGFLPAPDSQTAGTSSETSDQLRIFLRRPISEVGEC